MLSFISKITPLVFELLINWCTYQTFSLLDFFPLSHIIIIVYICYLVNIMEKMLPCIEHGVVEKLNYLFLSNSVVLVRYTGPKNINVTFFCPLH